MMSRVSHFSEVALLLHCFIGTLLECKNVVSPWKLEMHKIKTQNRKASISTVLLITNKEAMCWEHLRSCSLAYVISLSHIKCSENFRKRCVAGKRCWMSEEIGNDKLDILI